MSSQLQTNLNEIDEGIEILNNYAEAILNHTEYSPLPYIELEYITFTGTQSIDFGYELWATDNWRIDWKMMLADLHDYQSLFSITKGDSASPNESWVYRDNKLAIRFNNIKQETHSLSANTLYECQLYRNGTTVYTVVNNSSHSYNYGITNLSGNLRFGNTPTGTRRFTGRLYGFKFTNNSTQEVLRNFIPVKRKSDDAVCFYDTVTKTYITSAGSGQFIAGPEK